LVLNKVSIEEVKEMDKESWENIKGEGIFGRGN
jgi:hypothetical protein